jgi:hypothetical protein
MQETKKSGKNQNKKWKLNPPFFIHGYFKVKNLKEKGFNVIFKEF